MKVGVPGEFHEDRWQLTAEDSERRVIPRTREVGGTHRIQVIAWRRGSSGRSSARLPCPQVPQWHPSVAKGASISTLARVPLPQVLLGQGRVAKGRKSVPLPGLRSSLRPGLARHHRISLPSSPERPSMTRGSDSSKVEPRKTTSGDLISIIRRSNAQSQLKASTIS